jgi:biotin-(acetyl-CoA carboxylase) ligase
MKILSYFPSQLPKLIKKIEANLYQTGKMVNISRENEQISGKCLGLNTDGSLRVLTETGEKAVVSGVVV